MTSPFEDAILGPPQSLQFQQEEQLKQQMFQLEQSIQPPQPIQFPQMVQPQQMIPQPPQMVQPQQTQQIQVENEFIPTLQSDQMILLKMGSAKFDLFVKTLSYLDDKNVITINNSQICQSVNNNTTIIFADLKELLGVNINLQILSPKKYLKHFKNIKGGIVYFIESINDQRYIVTNGDITLYLPKQIENISPIFSIPDITISKIVSGLLDIDKDVRNTISNLAGEEALELIIKNNQLKGVYIPETAIYVFKQFIKENITDAVADLKLKCFSFLKIPAEKYTVGVYHLDNIYWLVTGIDNGIKFWTFENIQPVNDANLII